LLREAGAEEVQATALPPGLDNAKNGIDDWLATSPPQERAGVLRKLLDEAQPVSVVNEAADDPHRLARLYITERCEHPDGLTLRRWREQWHRWDGSAYRAIPDAELQGELTASAKHEMDRLNMLALKRIDPKDPPPTVRKITRGMIGNVEMALASLTCWPGTIEPPLWWDGKEWRRRNLIALSNGLLDLDALFAGEDDVLLPHTPRWFSPACLPYPFDPQADCPAWRAVLERNLEGDTQRIAVLQECFGYCVTADTSQQKFFLLEGEGANGKSVVCAALEATLGSENCSHVPLELFGARFQLEATLGKLANIASEVGELDKAAEGFLKSFTAGEAMQFERKHKPTFSATPTARLVLATNNRPRFSDRSAGVWRRMILMPFRVTIAADDPGRVFGMDKPEWWVESGELPGLFNWALEGLRRLREQGRFTTSEVCDQALKEYRTENNPARLFLTETCEEKPDGQIRCEVLYQAYRRWCEENGYSPLADRAFGKEVVRVFPRVERRRVGPRGGQLHYYCGIHNTAAGVATIAE
jgi:P4 family phage/plasmid primase-like protien